MALKPQYDLRAVIRHFRVEGDYVSAEPYGSGHINDTYAVTFDQAGARDRYILQRINHHIFKNPPAVMENIERATRHIREKMLAAGADEVSRRVLTVVPTEENSSFYRDGNGNFWRVYLFIERARTYDFIESPRQAYEAARTFGEFQRMLVDLPGKPLNETIPDFHHTPSRFAAFEKSLAADARNRAQGARAEIDFALRQKAMASVLLDLRAKGEIPFRITHNDTKINNVMLDDQTGKGICVIDLDTLMPGLALYDFGDMVRTSTSPAAEDEKDLSKVQMQKPMFEALVKGYLETAGEFLNRPEKSHLVFAGKLITFEIGLRFLTDYLSGDVYFKVHREGHNLDRCRTQFKLVESIAGQEEELNRFIEKL